MSDSSSIVRPAADPISTVLKWILLATGLLTAALLIWTTAATYRGAPPQPGKFVSAEGVVLMTDADIVSGESGFQKADLMDYGSLYGMGSYYGEDYTASIMKRLALATRDNIASASDHAAFASLPAERQDAITAKMRSDLHHLDLTAPTVTLPDELAAAIVSIRAATANGLLHPDRKVGWTAAESLSPVLADKTADFLIYSALTTVAWRPGTEYSWTQNWPYGPLVGNAPTGETFIWTWASFGFVFLAFGVVLFIYEFWLDDADTEVRDAELLVVHPLTPSQKKVWKYFLLVAVLLLVQILVGSIMAHMYYDRTSFYGFDINRYVPFNVMRDLHIQAPIVWIGLSWIGAALFLAPVIAGGKEARGQAWLVDALFWTTVFVVVCGLAGNYLGVLGVIDGNWFWFGNQGRSYIQLGRFWQIGFFAGLSLWSVLVMRALWPSVSLWTRAARDFWSGHIRLEHLIWASTVNVAVLYACGMIPLTGIEKSFTISDFWRWWVVHLWVEQSFEFFAAAMTAWTLMATGLISRRLAERGMYFEVILIFLGGVIGTGHHLYWAGAPSLWIPFGTMFSFIEVLPLVLLVMEGISHYRMIKGREDFRYRLGTIYVIGAAFWNFVGAGVYGGGLLNAPLVNYYEHGTFLTLNHAHSSLFGAFGELAIGLIYFCLRYLHAEESRFSERAGLWAFWLYNTGLVLWTVLNFFPIGWPQLLAVYEHGYAYARSAAFYDKTLFWQWMRLPGDVVFAAGALIMAWDFFVKLAPVYPGWMRRLVPGAKARAASRATGSAS
ncbi:nitric-oxide reductase large subunit [Acidomonas methanolica]|uniref:nitric-oxide reductase large subunit n=1 Tax=Acidomonas methanolica TaxID=437 RepID=UPI00211A8728|nr:cbb3-type cytochrome c oxidase subunit I [Acidomonas methanolica]MCQ9156632.1 cbb3-type cytochrome c oxidase subunit I [Acidomonas methanolica]